MLCTQPALPSVAPDHAHVSVPEPNSDPGAWHAAAVECRMSHAAAHTTAQHVSAASQQLLCQLLLVAGPAAAVLPVSKRKPQACFFSGFGIVFGSLGCFANCVSNALYTNHD